MPEPDDFLLNRVAALEREVGKLRTALRRPNLYPGSLGLARALHDLGNVPHAILRKAADQSITNATVTKLLLDTVVLDNDRMFDSANNELVVRTAGVYLCAVNVKWATGFPIDSFHFVAIGRNTVNLTTDLGWIAQFGAGSGTVADAPRGATSTLFAMAIGDTLEVHVYQNSTAARLLIGANTVLDTTPLFTVVKVADQSV